MIIAFTAITLGISLIWVSAEKLEKYSVLTAQKFGLSPFFIGSTVIAFGTSAPEMLTTFFVSLEGKGTMVIGNVIGSNVANLSLVFGSMLFVVSLRKLTISESNVLLKLLLSLIALVFAAWLITKGANLILEEFDLGELFIGYTVLAIGTSSVSYTHLTLPTKRSV